MRRTRVKYWNERGKPIKSMPMSVIGMFRQLTGERLQLAVVSDVLMESFPQFEMTYLGQAIS
jgi:hypothetical protein